MFPENDDGCKAEGYSYTAFACVLDALAGAFASSLLHATL